MTVLVTVTLCCAVAGSGAPAPGSAAIAAGTAETPVEAEVVAQINAFRASQGLAPFATSAVLDAFAASHARDMLAKGYFSHDEPGGPTALERLTAMYGPEGYDLTNTGENIAASAGPGDATVFVQSLIADPPHRDALLGIDRGPLYTNIGVSVVTADSAPGVYAGLGQVSILTTEIGPPQPVYGQSVLVSPVSGVVRVERPGARTFTPLTATTVIDTGTQVDTTKGRVRMTSVADALGTLQTADFYSGLFAVTYVPDFVGTSPNLVTNLNLTGPLTGCPRVKRQLALQSTKRPPKRKGPKVRSLWGKGIGHFRTQGAYASATVRGTYWLTQDACTSTRVRVVTGVVDVFNIKRNIHTSVTAGHSVVVRKSK